MGCDIDWGTAHQEGAAGESASADVIPAAGNDDGDDYEESDALAPAAAPAAAARPPFKIVRSEGDQ